MILSTAKISRSGHTQERSGHPLRIMHVIDDLGLGGAQRQLVELVKNIPPSRAVSEVVSLSVIKDDYSEALHDAGVPLTQIDQSGKWSWSAFNSLFSKIRSSKPDLVQTWLFTAGLYGRPAARLAGVPVVLSTIRSVDADKPAHYILADRLLKYLTTAFIVNADAGAGIYSKREKISPRKIHTIYNGLDLNYFRPGRTGGSGFRAAHGIPETAFVFGIVGRLQPVKDHATFIRAAAKAAGQHADIFFVIVGNGPLRETLSRQAAELGLGARILFVPGRPDIVEAFASFDALVVSSLYEGCCNVILEAMAMQKPVIATEAGGNPELVREGENGLLVPVRDSEALASAMGRLARDPESARRMGLRGRCRAEAEFSIERMVSRTLELYDAVCESKTAGRTH